MNSLPPATLEFAHRMFDAAREGNSELLLAAIDAGLPVNLCAQKNKTAGNTLLMLASYSNHPTLVSGLLARRADPNRLNDHGQSPIAGAVFKGYEEVVRVLSEGGADPWLGQPSAVEAAVMFDRKRVLEMMGIREGDVARVTRNVPVGPGVAMAGAGQCPIGRPRDS